MMGYTTLGKRIASACLATLTALQPLTGYAQGIGEAIRNADKPLPHVLPIANAADMLPLPFVPKAWTSRAETVQPTVPPTMVAQLLSELQPDVPSPSAPLGDRPKALAASTTTLTAAPNTSTFGATRTLTATVASTATVTGTVNFTEGATALCSAVALAGASATSKTATCVVAATATAGAHTYTAAYGGNTTAAASSGTLAHTINKATPTVALVSDLASPTTAQSFVLTATMSLNTATGSVDFKEGATVRCAAVALTGTTTKTATCTIPATTVGAHTYTSNYLSDANHNTATVNKAVTVVALTASATAIAVSPSPSTYGATRTLTATVTPSATTGTVNFTESGTTLTGCGAVALTGTTTKTATCVVAATAATAGAHTYAGAYSGDSTYATSSATVAHTVSKATAAVATAATPASPTVGQSVVLTATITPNTATSNVDFKEGATVRCAAVVITGTTTKTATCTIAAANATQGAHTYTTNYLGDSNHNTATVNTAVTVAALTASTTTIAASPSPSTYGATRTLTATVTPAATTGTVNFTEGGTTLTGCGAATLTGTTTKTATCVVAATAAAAGAHTYAAAYGGDSTYATSSGTVAHTVNKAAAAASVISTPASIQSGQAFTLTATINPNTATGTVAFTDGATALAGCSAVVLTGTTTKTAVCNVAAASATTGTHTYNVNYSPDSNHTTASASLITNIVAAPGASSVVLTANPNPGAVGQSVVLTATVTPNTATGSINFTESGSTLSGCGAVALSGTTTKSATCTVASSAVTLGAHAYAAAYGGDGSLAGSNGSLSLTVGKRNTTVTTVVNPAAPVSNQAFTIDATVADSAATGTITVSEGGTTICNALPLSTTAPKTATCNMPGPTAASHTYTVSYSGDSNVNSANTTATVGVTAAPDDDDDGILPIIIAALRPKCDSMTATPSSVSPGTSFNLTVNCTFKGNLVKDYVWAGSGVPNPTLTTVSNYTVSAAPTTAGTYAYSVLANNGNVPGSLQSVNVTVLANAPPTVAITSPSAGVHIPYRSNPNTGTVQANDTDSGIASIQITIDGANWGTPCTFSPAPGVLRQCQQPIRSDLPIGTHSYGATATDGSGATTTAAAVAYIIDPVSANCTLTANPASVLVGGTAALTATCTVFDGMSGTTIGLQGASVAWSTTPACASSTTTTDGSGVATCTTASLSAASTFSFTATKPNYAASGASVSVAIASANPPPKILSISPSTPSFLLNTAGVFIVQASDDTALTTTSLQFSSANTLPGASISCPGGTTESCSVSWTPTNTGVYTLGLQLTDSQGAVTTATSAVAVSETPGEGVPSLPSVAGTAKVGTTAGQFAVSESGAATYSIPIQVPPGVAGLQPNLALTYNSQGGDGPLGVGWNLSGLSSITRCPKTIATDGIREPINYDNVTDPITGNDAFCLDGQRLIPVSGGITSVACVFPVGSAATPNNNCTAWEFRTEMESYSRIIGIGDGAVAGTSGSGPTRFRVYAKSGQILEYGSRWWGLGAPRPDPQTSLITNPSFEDTVVTDDAPYLADGTTPNPAYNPNIAFGQSAGYPASWGYFLTNAQATSQGWYFTNGGDANSGAGVERNGSNWSTTQPTQTVDGAQAAFIQRLGQASTRPYLEAGWYTLGFKLAGRATGSASFGGNQRIDVRLDGSLLTTIFTSTGQGFTPYSLRVYVPSSMVHELMFAGMQPDDQTALLDAVTLVPENNDILSVKVFPLDRVEDRSGNYMHIDYGGTHEPQNLTNPDGSVTPFPGTLVDSYGTAQLPSTLTASRQIALVAQGARPALEMHPRRISYGMRTTVPGDGNNRASATGVEIARVILNYECIDGSVPDAPTGSCLSRSGVNKFYDTGAGQMLLSKRLASIWTLVGGSDDTSLATDRADFHYNEANTTYKPSNAPTSAQCLNGLQSNCGTLMRRYALTYGNSPSSGRVRLNSVTECSGDDVCLQPTNFGWQDSALTLNATGGGSQVVNDGADWNSLLAQGRVADVVGDGRSRIVRRGANPGNVLVVCTHNGVKFICDNTSWLLPPQLPPLNTQFRYEIPSGGANRSWFMADINGDGIADLIAITSSGTAFGCTSTGTGFGACANVPAVTSGTRYYAKTGDFDGDGRMDIAFYRGDAQFEICRASGGTASAPTLSWICNTPTPIQGLPISFASAGDELDHLMIADFNGDGRADIAYRVANVCVLGGMGPYGKNVVPPMPQQQCKDTAGNAIQPTTTDSYWSVCFAAGPPNAITFQCATHSGGGLNGAVKTVSGKPSLLVTYDFNGDGLADMATDVPGQGWRICLSTGDGEFADRDSAGDCKIWQGPLTTTAKTVAGDFNGDGRTDLAYFDTGVNQWRICLSRGTGFVLDANNKCPAVASPAASPAIDSNQQAEAFAGDFNGDGKTDLAVNGLNTNGMLSYGFTDSTMPDLVASVTTGLAAISKVNYVPLSNSGGIYSKSPVINSGDPNPGTLADNEIAIQSPMYVVASTLASTGNNSSQYYKSSYAYQNLRADKWGRGLSGFYRRSVTDNVIADVNGTVLDDTNAQVTGVIYNQAWPHIGRPMTTAKLVKAPNGTFVTVSSSVMSYFSYSAPSGINRTDGAAGQYTLWKSYQTKSIQNPLGTDRDLDTTSPLPKVTTYTGIDPATQVADIAMFYDGFSNPRKIVTVTEHPSSSETWTQAVTNNYYDAATGGGDTTRWLLGKLQDATTVTSVSGYTTNGLASVTRKSSFTYQGIAGGACTGAAPGQLCTETVEPDRAVAGTYSLYQQSAYTYDAFGNRLSSSANFYNDDAGTGGLQTRSSSTTYQYGKYPLVNTRAYTGNAALNLSDTREYTDARCRMPTKVTDANGNYAEMQYDGFCRKVSESARTNTGNLVKWSTFTLANSTDSLRQPSAAALGFPLTGGESYAQITTTSDGGQSTAFYDNLQRAVRAQTRTFSGSLAEATTVYDALGRKSSMTQPVSSGTSTGTATTQYAYDALNRVTKETLPDDPSTTGTSIVRTEYNGLSTTVIRTNINAGSTAVGTSASAHSTKKTANAKGLVATVETGYRTNVTDPATSTSLTTINYAYDAIGNLTQVTSPGANSGTVTKTMSYDLRGRQTQLIDPDAGSYNYTYNGAGEQRTQTDARGFVTTTTYDPFGRKTTRTETQAAGGDATTTWSYDCANGKGLLCAVNYSGTGAAGNATSKTTAYDQYSRPVTTSTAIAGQSFVSQVAYDGRGRPLYSVYPQATLAAAQLALKQSYNSYGFATQTEHATTGFVYSTISSRNNDGQVNGATMGGGLLTQSNGYSGDGLGRIASISITGGTTLTQNFGFESVGNLKSRSLTGGGRTEVENFTYDALDRLLSSGAAAGNVTALPDAGGFGYDNAGNLNSKAGLTLGYAPASPNSNNRLCGIAVVNASTCTGGTGAIVYDGNGNIQSYTRPTAAQSGNTPGADGAFLQLTGYTAFNLPTNITKSLAGTIQASAEFFYDAGYQRVRQVKRGGAVQTGPFVDDILYVVPGGFEVHRNAAGQVTSSIATVSGPDGVVATVSTSFDPNTGLPVTQASVTNLSGATTVTKLLLKDHLGSMVAEFTVTAATAGTLVVHGFGPWGNARNGLNGDQRGFTGHEHLAELGIIHMNGRLYDAVIGRFLQADPIIQAPHNAQSHNRYSYVLNNPLSFTDPSGFSFWTKWRKPIIGIVASIVTAGAASAWMSAYALANGATMFATAAGGLTNIGVAAAAAAGGFAAGGINGGNIQSALRGAFMAALTVGIFQGIESLASGAESVGATMGASTAADSTSGTYSGTAGATATDAASGAATQLPQVVQRVEITGSSWTTDALDWLAKGPIDRNTVSGAVWMGMMAMPGTARGVSALRAAKSVAPSAYSVAARVEIKALEEGTRRAHFKQANGILKEAMESDPQLAKMMDSLSVRIPADMTKSPLNWTWHHVPNMPGTLELVPFAQHAPGSLFQPLFHFLPGNAGGFAQWGARF